MNLNVIILAGGEGKRLWPLVNEHRPKPLLKLRGNKTLLEETIDRFSSLGSSFVVMPKSRIPLTKQTIQNDSVEFIEEISPVGTSIAMRLAAEQFLGKELLLFTPCDQIIGDPKRLLSSIRSAKKHAHNGEIVLFGTKPTNPNTENGYISVTKDLRLTSFLDKPDKATAKNLYENPNTLWNMGISLMRADTLIQVWESFFDPDELNIEKSVWAKAPNVVAVNVNSSFKDLGTFEAICKNLEVTPNLHTGDAKKSIIYSESLPLRTEGVENMIIIATSYGLLVKKRKLPKQQPSKKMRKVLSKK